MTNTIQTAMDKITTFEWYWSQYISKLARLDELKAKGRYGYQLHMPKKAIQKARIAMEDWCKTNGVECP